MGLQLVHIGNYDYQLFCKKREHRASPGSHAPSPESHADVLAARTARLAVLLVASGVVALTTWSLWQSDAQEAWEELCGVAGCAQSACASLLRHIFLDILGHLAAFRSLNFRRRQGWLLDMWHPRLVPRY